jgi:hypothetical protein
MAEKESVPKSGGFSFFGALGFLAFITGIILAIIAGNIAGPSDNHSAGTISNMVLTLAILGIIVGLLTITAREVLLLMVAAIALIVVGNAGFTILDEITSGLGTTINDMLYYFGRLMAPAAVIAAVRALFAVGFPD